MSSKKRYEEQARHNEMLRSSVPDTHPDWELTVILYSALHYLRAFLSSLCERYSGDDLRYDMLIINLEREGQPLLGRHFRDLKNTVHRARYECRPMSWASGQLTDSERSGRECALIPSSA